MSKRTTRPAIPSRDGYTITSYPMAEYKITDDGDIVRLDGSPIAPDKVYVADEHLAIAIERKRRAKP